MFLLHQNRYIIIIIINLQLYPPRYGKKRSVVIFLLWEHKEKTHKSTHQIIVFNPNKMKIKVIKSLDRLAEIPA